jgi:hypothetical protein
VGIVTANPFSAYGAYSSGLSFKVRNSALEESFVPIDQSSAVKALPIKRQINEKASSVRFMESDEGLEGKKRGKGSMMNCQWCV